MQQIKGLIVRRDAHMNLIKEDVILDNSLHGIYEVMGVHSIEVPIIGDGWQMIVDEEGKINGKWAPTMSAEPFGFRDVLFGPVLFLGLTEDGDNCDLTDKQKDEILKLYRISQKTPWIFTF